MEAAELLRQGKLDEALEALQNQIRNDPSNSKHRVFLFQLLCVMGQWDRALTQLNVAAGMDPKTLLMKEVCQQALQCEALRKEIFEGKKMPLVFGQPQEWVGWMIQANQQSAQGQYREAQELRERALEAAPAIAGRINSNAFEWVADADPRLGPILEVILEGRYFWIPLANINQIKIDKPVDLRDVIWAPANFVWSNGGTAVGFIPARYPGSDQVEDPAIKLGRRTDWIDQGGDFQVPVGQRLFATNEGEYSILEVRALTLGQPIMPASDREEVAHG
ncbi:MAG TPA: type VI secretion system accessory protein TagJ [Tepidisphaeraceae bacterium]|jgi:type VI secretion system protein ImpE|nr:type VI secretion system accessory protein TagJ [Tepidisphaeraceae bacterium]